MVVYLGKKEEVGRTACGVGGLVPSSQVRAPCLVRQTSTGKSERLLRKENKEEKSCMIVVSARLC